MSQVRKGQRVRVRFSVREPEALGYAYDGSADDPLEFAAGSDEVVAGLAGAVVGMQVGERKTVTVAPEAGFGARDDSLRVEVPRTRLPKEAQIGDRVELELEDGQTAPAWIAELHAECAHLDGNHPLAGKILIFDIELLSVS